MAQSVFISSSASDDVTGLQSALRAAGFLTVGPALALPGEDIAGAIDSALASAEVLLVLLPPVESSWVRFEIERAQELGKPIVLIRTSASRVPDAYLRSHVTLRSDLDDPSVVIDALRARLAHAVVTGVPSPDVPPALGPGDVQQWTISIQNAADDYRLERQVSILLSNVGVELSPPREVGPDFVAWSDELAGVVGNPFLVQITRGSSWTDEAAQRRWLSRAGLMSLVLLLGSEDSEVAVESTAAGQTILHLPVIELIGELGISSLQGAVRALVRRTGVEL